MPSFKFLITTFLSILLIACGDNSGSNKKDFSINTNTKKNVIDNATNLTVSIKNTKKHTIDSISYTIVDDFLKTTAI